MTNQNSVFVKNNVFNENVDVVSEMVIKATSTVKQE